MKNTEIIRNNQHSVAGSQAAKDPFLGVWSIVGGTLVQQPYSATSRESLEQPFHSTLSKAELKCVTPVAGGWRIGGLPRPWPPLSSQP